MSMIRFICHPSHHLNLPPLTPPFVGLGLAAGEAFIAPPGMCTRTGTSPRKRLIS
jgi:hypothetical protein